MTAYKIAPEELTNGQVDLLAMLRQVKQRELLPEMYPLGIGEQPEIPVTFDELAELQRAGLVLYDDYIKNVGNKAYNAYLIQRGTDLKAYEKELETSTV